MIKYGPEFEKWENELIASEPVDYLQNFRMLDEMVELARHLGVWPPADPREDAENRITLARALHDHRSH